MPLTLSQKVIVEIRIVITSNMALNGNLVEKVVFFGQIGQIN
jgi:TnpA family transposase